MTQTSYKFWYHRQEDDGTFVKCAVAFYEGEVSTKDEHDLDEIKSVTRYRRTKKLNKQDLPHFENKEVEKDSAGNEYIVFTSEDFGEITNEKDLVKFLNKELMKDKTRIPITEQL